MSDSGFSISTVASGMGDQLKTETESLGDMMKDFNPDDPMASFQMEMEVAKYKAEMSLMAALVKDLSDVQQQIIQKV